MSRRRMALVAAQTTAMALWLSPANAAPKEFSDEDVTAALKAVISERSKNGVFSFTDQRTGDELALVLEDVRIVRGLPAFGWFPNVAFHDSRTPAKKYTLDFWLKPDGDVLKLVDIRVHKAPRADGAGWMTTTRSPLAWWWLPTMKRASAEAGMPAWKVMGAIHSEIAKAAKDKRIPIAVEIGGSTGVLQFVDIEQPVGRSKTDDRYFACALLRKFGTEPVFYSTAYWLDGKTNLVTAGGIRQIDVDRNGGGKAATEPRCDFGGVAFDVVD
ncbi:MAG: hypothetical protein ACK4TP_17840 [Hyphomicrobium sp.]